jgi:hypothetical protein
MRGAWRDAGAAGVQRRDLGIAVMPWATDLDAAKWRRVLEERAQRELRDIRSADEIALLGPGADQLRLALGQHRGATPLSGSPSAAEVLDLQHVARARPEQSLA